MSRWTIEKDGTGIEKSGTGIEKSGTGIERSGTGIEKSGTGIRQFAFACLIASAGFASNLQAGSLPANGSLQLVIDGGTIAASWIIDGSVFAGVGTLSGSGPALQLTEVAVVANPVNLGVTDSSNLEVQVTGGGTGSTKQVTGGGTGSSKNVTGGGTGSGTPQVTGGGTGLKVQVTGGGTGSSTLVTGGGTGSSTLVTGGGTGSSTLVTGGGTGTSILVSKGSSMDDAIAINLPDGTGLAMEISLGCGTADVTVLDSAFAPVVMFEDVSVIGDTGLCGEPLGGHLTDPGLDFRSN